MLVKIIQITISSLCLYRLQVVDIKSLILEQQKYLYHNKGLIAKAMVSKSMILEILEIFVKELNLIKARWDLEPYHWSKQGWVPEF